MVLATKGENPVRDDYLGIEFGLWRNGEPQTQLFIFNLRVGKSEASYEHVINLTSIRNPAMVFRVRLTFNGELVDDWVTGRMWLEDTSGYPISTPRPFLMFLGVTDLPMTTVFPSHHERPLSHTGIWVVSTRLALDSHRLDKIHFGMPKAGEPE